MPLFIIEIHGAPKKLKMYAKHYNLHTANRAPTCQHIREDIMNRMRFMVLTGCSESVKIQPPICYMN